jgi:hypothetical protein
MGPPGVEARDIREMPRHIKFMFTTKDTKSTKKNKK